MSNFNSTTHIEVAYLERNFEGEWQKLMLESNCVYSSSVGTSFEGEWQKLMQESNWCIQQFSRKKFEGKWQKLMLESN